MNKKNMIKSFRSLVSHIAFVYTDLTEMSSKHDDKKYFYLTKTLNLCNELKLIKKAICQNKFLSTPF